MRKFFTFALAGAVFAFGVPAQAATTVGGKCTTRLAVAKAGAVKVYCGKNTNAKTKASYKLAWVKSTTLYKDAGKPVGCYELIVQNQETQAKAADAQKQMADIKDQLKALDTATAATVGASVASLQGQVDMLVPLAQSLADNVAQVCP